MDREIVAGGDSRTGEPGGASGPGPERERSRGLSLRDGVVAGLLAGATVAVFFFFLDVVQDEAFRTPAFLAEAIFDGTAEPTVGLIALFTALHFLTFAVVGVGAVLLFRWAELPPNLLSGGIYGLFVCTLLFYVSLIVTGATVLPAPWWPSVLVGNLLAGFVLGIYLHWVGPQPGMTGIRNQLRLHGTLREGLVAGVIGGVTVAAWFLIVDLAIREPFYTPAALGSAFFLGVGGPQAIEVSMATVLGYTAVHFAAFLLFGIVVAGLVAQAERFPPLIFALLLLFVVFEVFFIGHAAMFGTWVLDELAWWSVLVGNLLAAASMGSYLWRAHPVLQEELRDGAMWVE